MSDAAFITTIVSICLAFLGAMGLVAQVLGARIADVRDESRLGVENLRDETRLGVEGLRDEIRVGFEALRSEMRVDFRAVRDEMRAGFAAVNGRIDEQSGRITRVEQRLDVIAQTVAEQEGRLK